MRFSVTPRFDSAAEGSSEISRTFSHRNDAFRQHEEEAMSKIDSDAKVNR
jgi:hypothetical protein